MKGNLYILSIGSFSGAGNRFKGKHVPIPDYLKNCVFYYDKDLSTVTDSGTLQVTDLTLGVNHLKQTVSGEKPATLNGLTFDNTDDNLKFDTPIYIPSKSFTIYLRYNRAVAVDDTILMGDLSDTYGDQIWMLFRASSIAITRGAGSGANFTGLNASDITGDHLYKFTGDGTNVKFFVDGVEKGSVAWPASWVDRTYLQIKSLGSYNASYQRTAGVFTQIMIFNNKITAEQEALVEAQLSAKSLVNYSLANKDCILFTGQSNTPGRQVIANYPAQYQSNTKLKILDLSTAKFKLISESIDVGEGKNGTIDLYRSFETSYSYLKSSDLYLLKFGVGSTYLADKTSNINWNINETSTAYMLYVQLKRHWLLTNQLLKSIGINPNWIEQWWMQGEQDAVLQADADAYQQNLIDWITAWRAFTGLNTKFVIMRIYGPPDSSQAYYLTVQAAQNYAAANITNVKIISTNAYSKSDIAHYNVAGYLQGGTDLFNQNYIL